MFAYFADHSDQLMSAFWEHLGIVFSVLLISIILAAVICWFLLRSERATNIVVNIFSEVYSIPSLALFALLIPLWGLGNKTAIPVLVLYNQYLLIRNFMTGMQNVDKSILEAGTGMGMSKWQLVTKVQLPLAMPSIVAGIRLAIISTTGIATIAATINAGGLGKILLSGLRTMNTYKIIWGTILCVLIALLADTLLRLLEKKIAVGNKQIN
ncbi:ABC transporter permease [Ruminococcus sp.]|uniref:ABC transporter permease n=1 Tax=Ruminococcus sp. TaxID=41978 RepID=UPI00388D37E2